ncbi:hypothetical protein T08_7657 [Trichinella sp. T8]|nr:hypothetical protein T08_7657 [Trichinella sp. T8]
MISAINFVLIKEKNFSGKLQNFMGYRLSCFLRKSAKEMFDFGTNFHRPIILVVELAILLYLRAVVLLRDVIGMFFFGPTVHLLVVDHAILLDRQIFVVLVFLLLGRQI